ncbi:hypothetical protein [Tateyamaria sp. SN3-11]|uniref:hypothetical protein n=1 Tax=Tateyamaria sp. SN3-11 TaxID=3092147 RepID=UPI0039EA4327
MIYLITCAFVLACPAFSDCGNVQDDGPITVKVRLQESTEIAEFWTPGSPESLPWPAIFIDASFGSRVWSFFTAGDLHGAWMLSVAVPKTDEAPSFEAQGKLSVHVNSFMTDRSVLAAQDTCIVEMEQA